jgi:hypothetical protein
MQQSGTRLVVGVMASALALCGGAWWYQYATIHRAADFWGPQAAQLIARPSRASGQRLEANAGRNLADDLSATTGEPIDLTQGRGMVHLRNALLKASNYDWDETPSADKIAWQWILRLEEGDEKVLVLFSDDFATIANYSPQLQSLKLASSRPMAESLREFFASIVDDAASIKQ